MTVNYQDLGLRVRDARKAKHLTQEQLAEKVGIYASFMGHIERGTRIASIDTLVSSLQRAVSVAMSSAGREPVRERGGFPLYQR